MITLKVKTQYRCQFLDITRDITKAVRESGIPDGILLIFCPHTTAGITINENADPAVLNDINLKTSKFVDHHDPDYRHGEGNSDSHIKSSFFGASETVIIERGTLVLGQWQGIFFAEFDGPRNREVFLKTIPG
ncbi:MAG TPA: secondary thiamine-phosphate synthase enzyme YjbQ [Nitrospinota bacterium]|jgi:secondary thiamine-phosphate synthase enzyme|nr:secondary thiamine-phosphate synthase enzyme YjbQ [Nitrospinota bacterium]